MFNSIGRSVFSRSSFDLFDLFSIFHIPTFTVYSTSEKIINETEQEIARIHTEHRNELKKSKIDFALYKAKLELLSMKHDEKHAQALRNLRRQGINI